jgi:hypothetical protein
MCFGTHGLHIIPTPWFATRCFVSPNARGCAQAFFEIGIKFRRGRVIVEVAIYNHLTQDH